MSLPVHATIDVASACGICNNGASPVPKWSSFLDACVVFRAVNAKQTTMIDEKRGLERTRNINTVFEIHALGVIRTMNAVEFITHEGLVRIIVQRIASSPL
jgi:hypothetical protein